MDTVAGTGFCEHHLWEISVKEWLLAKQSPFVFQPWRAPIWAAFQSCCCITYCSLLWKLHFLSQPGEEQLTLNSSPPWGRGHFESYGCKNPGQFLLLLFKFLFPFHSGKCCSQMSIEVYCKQRIPVPRLERFHRGVLQLVSRAFKLWCQRQMVCGFARKDAWCSSTRLWCHIKHQHRNLVRFSCDRFAVRRSPMIQDEVVEASRIKCLVKGALCTLSAAEKWFLPPPSFCRGLGSWWRCQRSHRISCWQQLPSHALTQQQTKERKPLKTTVYIREL